MPGIDVRMMSYGERVPTQVRALLPFWTAKTKLLVDGCGYKANIDYDQVVVAVHIDRLKISFLQICR